jgi:hypothetical protein
MPAATARPNWASCCATTGPEQALQVCRSIPAQVLHQPVHVAGKLRVAVDLHLGRFAGHGAHEQQGRVRSFQLHRQIGRGQIRLGASSSRPAGVMRQASTGGGGNSAGQPTRVKATVRPACGTRRSVATRSADSTWLSNRVRREARAGATKA